MQPKDGTIDRTGNNFDFLRLLAAFSVLIFHSYFLLGHYDPLTMLTGTLNFGSLGVGIFFVISGYLIAKSWCSRPAIGRYLWSRCLRIVPGLVLLSAFTVFVVGPLVTTYPLVDYFTSGLTWSFFRVVTVFGIFPHTPTLPGVFLDNPSIGAVNGNLWTLPVEFGMYLGIMVLGVLGLLGRKRLVLAGTVLVAAGYLVLTEVPAGAVPVAPYQVLAGLVSSLSLFIIYPILFMAGTLLYLFRDRVSYDIRVFLAVLAVWIVSLPFNVLSHITFIVCLPYLVLAVAQMRIPKINYAGKYGDFSYGMYIYGAMMQQVVINFFPGIAPEGLLVLSAVVTLPLAIVSWHLVEARALRLKKIDVGRILSNALGKTGSAPR